MATTCMRMRVGGHHDPSNWTAVSSSVQVLLDAGYLGAEPVVSGTMKIALCINQS